jgi:hypothetical protein
MDQTITDFINGKRIAVVGVSRRSQKFGTMIYKELKARGYQVYPVHPEAKEIAGDACFPSLSALQDKVDGAVVCISPKDVVPVLKEAANIGLRNIWLQQGAQSPAAIQAGKELGLNMVTGKCILMYAMPVRSFHSFHRFLAKLFGKL